MRKRCYFLYLASVMHQNIPSEDLSAFGLQPLDTEIELTI
jgi:hypothetical protein